MGTGRTGGVQNISSFSVNFQLRVDRGKTSKFYYAVCFLFLKSIMNSVLLALLLVLFTGLGYLAYVLGHKNRYFFKDRKINYLKPQFIFGNSLLIFRKNIYDFLGIINKDFKDDK